MSRQHHSLALATLIAALTGFLLAVPLQAAPDVTPGALWPAGERPSDEVSQSWRIWQTRCGVRTSPTTLHDASDRLAALRLWMGELSALGLPVADVVSREALGRLGQLVNQRTGDGVTLPRGVDAAFRALERLAHERGATPGAGEIRGRVTGAQGEPLAEVDVVVRGTPLGAVTGSDGAFVVSGVPCVGTRWTVWAHRDGYLDAFVGRLAPSPGTPAEASLVMELASPESRYRDQRLMVRFARLVDVKQTADPAQPIELAAITPASYPEAVRPYLTAAPWLDCDHPAVIAQAQQIAAAIAESERARSTAIARAVFAWVARNVSLDTPRGTMADAASGAWQLTQGAWGPDLGEWFRRPSEVLAERRALSAEMARLAAAMLRALGIAARPVTTWGGDACQWWVQLPAGNGYWVTTDPAALRATFARTGRADLQAGLVCDDEVGCYGVDERGEVHATWRSAAPLLWRYDPGEIARTGRSEKGPAGAQASLTAFARQGVLQGGQSAADVDPTPARRGAPSYVVAWSGLELDLRGQGATRQFTVRFPMGVSNQWRTTIDGKHWTNHPEWVKAARRERHSNALTGESMDWYCVDYDLGTASPTP